MSGTGRAVAECMDPTPKQIAATAAAIENALESGRPLLERAAALFIAAELEKHRFSPVETAEALGIGTDVLRRWCSAEQVQRVIGSNSVATESHHSDAKEQQS